MTVISTDDRWEVNTSLCKLVSYIGNLSQDDMVVAESTDWSHILHFPITAKDGSSAKLQICIGRDFSLEDISIISATDDAVQYGRSVACYRLPPLANISMRNILIRLCTGIFPEPEYNKIRSSVVEDINGLVDELQL